MKKAFLTILIFTSFFNSKIIANENDQLKKLEDSLNHYFSMLLKEDNDANKIELNSKIVALFKKALQQESSFYYPFFDLQNVGLIRSDDYKLRIITWNLPYNDRTHKYYGFIQYKRNKKDYVFYELKDCSEEIKNPEMLILNSSNWYGALYYKIITNKSKGKDYYTLLGADLNNLLTKKKVIDILYFDKNNLPVFGDKVFKNKIPPVARVIFEFNGQTNMTLAYDDKKEMIVFDHLSPSKPSLTGQFEFYGPDFSYDGLKFERGIWNSYTDIDVRDYSIGEF